MKYRLISIALLAILIFNIFRFEIPYIQYAIFKSYIAKNLCVNRDKPKSCCEGKCFREKQVKIVNETSDTETAKESNTTKIPASKEVKEFLPTQSILPPVPESSFSNHQRTEISITPRYISAIFVPPKA
ncbi:MAG: hypothetical protein JZU53_11620 [Paludibacter sp.]|nr:hypothetical protein [Paludibacter sp.]